MKKKTRFIIGPEVFLLEQLISTLERVSGSSWSEREDGSLATIISNARSYQSCKESREDERDGVEGEEGCEN